MQISGDNYISQSYGTSSSSKSKFRDLSSQDIFNLADYGDSSNTIFQNVLKDPSVQEDVSLNDDGTYSFKMNGTGPLNVHQQIAQALIQEQNGVRSDDPGAMTPYSVNDLEKFRQLTGYNLIQAAGGYTVVDDNGDAPTAEDKPMVTAAWNTFDLAKLGKDSEGEKGDLTVNDLKDAVEGLQSGAAQREDTAESDLLNTLLGTISTKFPSTSNDNDVLGLT